MSAAYEIRDPERAEIHLHLDQMIDTMKLLPRGVRTLALLVSVPISIVGVLHGVFEAKQKLKEEE